MPSRPPTTSWPHRLTLGCSTRVHSPIRCVSEMMSCGVACYFQFLFCYNQNFKQDFFSEEEGGGGGNVDACQGCMRASVYPRGFCRL